MSGRPAWKSAEIGQNRPFSNAFFAVFRRVPRAPGKSRKRRKKAFFLRYPRISLNPHLLNPHLRHSKNGRGGFRSQTAADPLSRRAPEKQTVGTVTAFQKKRLTLRLKWPFTEWETGPEQESWKNGKENGKWPQARNGRKMAIKMGKWTQNGILA